MDKELTTHIEADLLMEAIYKRYGYDFRHYSKESLNRRLSSYLTGSPYNHLSEIIPQIIHDEAFYYTFLSNILVSVTEFFRDSDFFIEFGRHVIPILHTYPFLKIWHAGSASGEEVYSMAILLKEAGLLEKTMLYGTDINKICLERAVKGIYPSREVEMGFDKYLESGGKGVLSDYFVSKYDLSKVKKELTKNIVFSNHNLVTDGVFGQMHVVICRNVLIYFNNDLQNQVIRLFSNSLINKGFLCLGPKERLDFLECSNVFEKNSDRGKIYRKK